MMLSDDQREAVFETDVNDRNGIRDVVARWPNRTVVYHINEEDFDEKQLRAIEAALADIANNSCVRFRKRESEDERAVIIQEGPGCSSNVGFKSSGQQVMQLGRGCFKHGTIVHEMLHTLGFFHMQCTYNRDDYVTIVWENIKPGREHNFKKYGKDVINDFDVPYDYDSVMHYPATAFSAHKEKTIIPIKENVEIGQRVGLSEGDILKLNRMYCDETEDKENEIEYDGDLLAIGK
ncbi:seminal metalloprotease 1-like [Trichoplusia ni]|uniref:Metalloendopeptidase n=1 Tax=Trichoplusia ni TaxID=7111 RepID=A0A7E5VCD2_TRINI|nr:seminal metalloprotease 1-like [Trichoplusia ni]